MPNKTDAVATETVTLNGTQNGRTLQQSTACADSLAAMTANMILMHDVIYHDDHKDEPKEE